MSWWLILLIVLVAGGLLMPSLVVPIIVYTIVFVRTSKKKWTRECSLPDDDEQVRMYAEAEEWAQKNKHAMREVDIVNEGFHLYGEYYDFGCDRAVIIIAGRTEGLRYSCYFAEPYRRAGFNVLVIDNRSHGRSDGVFNSLGLREYRDILAWGKLLHDECGMKKVVCHGICIGSATALYALTADDCPDYMAGMVADGMYTHFGESMKNHIIERHQPVVPCYQVVMFLVRLHSGRSAIKHGPISVMGKMKKPILFLNSREDTYSVPEKTVQLVAACNADKQLVWFDKGRHSCLRINAAEKYDQTVMAFLDQRFS
ncbi:MAG: lysophospholipase [Clostridia bacterium]|nr:lysophospholipase [Clostridia bacterium]